MSLVWVVLSGLAMSAISLVGAGLFVLPERVQAAILSPLVAYAAGSLLGGAAFHLMPSAIAQMGGGAAPWLWMLGGFAAFFLLETAIRSRHHHEHEGHTHPTATVWLILVADGLHNFVGGLAVSSAILVDPWLGLTVWLAEAAHEIPQELGDYAVLVQSGMSRRKALIWNLISGLTFVLGGLLAAAIAVEREPGFLLAFGAGNFLYLATVDLLPDVLRKDRRLLHIASVLTGVLVLLALKVLLPDR